MIWILVLIGVAIAFQIALLYARQRATRPRGKSYESSGWYYSMESALEKPERCVRLSLDNLHSEDLVDIGRLSHLRELVLSGDGLYDLPKALRSLPVLESLSLVHTGLAILPDWLGQLPQLQTLIIQNNYKLEELNGQIFAQLTNLRRLHLAGNRALPIPIEIFQIPLLESLTLSACQLREIPESIGNLQHLRTLDLSHNPIQQLPASLQDRPDLRIILS